MARSVITTDLLIPGRGAPVKKAALVWEDGKILWAGEESSLPAEFQLEVTKWDKVPVITPGLWDCHIHFLGTPTYSSQAMLLENRTAAGARGARDVAEVLNAGFTSVRETGGDGHEIAKGIAEGYLVGPKIYSAISVISPTGGHGDVHTMPIPMVDDACAHGFLFHTADGVPECLKAVRTQLRKGAKLIKLCASGGINSELDDPHHQEFSDEELKAIVDEARRADRIVAAHCHGKAGILAALRAGCKTIEHGSFLDDEAIQAMLDADAILVPTRSILQSGLATVSNWTEKSYKKLQATAGAHFEAYQKAIKAGVRISLGSDLGPSRSGTLLSHGKEGMELKYAVDAGMSPLQAIEAATAAAPDTLGPQAPLSGQLKTGYDADFLALNSNPLDDIDIFTRPENITHIWQSGKLVKSPEAGSKWAYPGLKTLVDQ